MNFKVGNDTYILLEERILHNKIRRGFNILSDWAKEELKREYMARFESIEEVENLISPLGISIINEIILRCEDVLNKEGINSRDSNFLKDKENSTMIWNEDCKNILSTVVVFENPMLLGGLLESLDKIIFKLKDIVIGKIIEARGNVVSKTITLEEEERCKALVEEYKNQVLNEKQALGLLELNPYNEDVYRLIIDKLGDNEKDIEKLCEKMDVDYYLIKNELLQKYYKNLNVDSEKDTLKSKESFIKYSNHIGFDINEDLIIEIDKKICGFIRQEDKRILKEKFNIDNIITVEYGEKLLKELDSIEIRTEGLKPNKKTLIEEKLTEIKVGLDEEKIRKVIETYVFLSDEQVYSAIEEIDELNVTFEWIRDKACESLSENIEKLIKEHRELLGRARRYEEEFIKNSKKENRFENIFKNIFKEKWEERYSKRVEKDKEAYDFITNFGQRDLDDME